MKAPARYLSAFIVIASTALWGYAQDVRLGASFCKDTVLVGEPVKLSVTLTNETDKPQFAEVCHSVGNRPLYIRAFDEEGNELKASLVYSSADAARCREFDPGQTWLLREVDMLSASGVEFRKPGTYTVKVFYKTDGKFHSGHRISATKPEVYPCPARELEAEAEFTVVPPSRKMDKAALEYMDGRWLNNSNWNIDETFRSFPDSTYAPYAKYYSATGGTGIHGQYKALKAIWLLPELINPDFCFAGLAEQYLAGAYAIMKDESKVMHHWREIARKYPDSYLGHTARGVLNNPRPPTDPDAFEDLE